MINIWGKNAAAIFNPKNWLKPEYSHNIKFVVGAGIAFYGMNELNKYYNNRNMWENPEGKEDKLMIPLDDGTTIGIPYLSSLATVPRTVIKTARRLVKGDIKGAGKEAGSMSFSMLLRPMMDIISNENYFGKQIYDPDDPTDKKYMSMANYLLNPVTGAYTHPYLREGVKYAQGKQPAYQALSQALELPIRYYKTQQLKESEVYEKLKESEKKSAQIKEEKDSRIMDALNRGNTSEAKKIINEDRTKKLTGKSLKDALNTYQNKRNKKSYINWFKNMTVDEQEDVWNSIPREFQRELEDYKKEESSYFSSKRKGRTLRK
jgi:hypothetical protein